ncbi:hypothetical protein HN51_012112, partial [Arachis hypogaea]
TEAIRSRGEKVVANITNHKDDEVIVVMVFEFYLVKDFKDCVVDFGATMHICAKNKLFFKFTPINNGNEVVYLGDSSKVSILGKGKVSMKMTSEKILVQSDELYVLTIKHCLMSVHLLNNAKVKITFDNNIVTLSKNNVY